MLVPQVAIRSRDLTVPSSIPVLRRRNDSKVVAPYEDRKRSEQT